MQKNTAPRGGIEQYRSNYTTSSNPVRSFTDVIRRDTGAAIDPVPDGQIHRFDDPEGKLGNDACWYVLHLDGIAAGSYGNWRTGIRATWCARAQKRFTPEERKAAARLGEMAKRKRREEERDRHQKAMENAQQLWGIATAATCNHGYLQAKHIQPYGLREAGGTLLVPLYADRQLVNVQRICAEGDKRFLHGGRVAGAYYPLRGSEDALYICEGMATAHTIHVLTGSSVAAAMNCGNLMAVAHYFYQRYPDLAITIAADNDRYTDGNPGISKGMAAAASINGLITWPRFPECSPGSDFNDLANLGAKVVL